ncbi:hypothetical protein [Gordonia otitidis]|uniref:hypothetical protein n=1 Tax=Gordonia otitidis TaxID=249058 RepID=UPI000586BE02|nr:hypothetical protein [Gordonia otitidis]
MTARRAPGATRDNIPGTGWVPGRQAPGHHPTQPLHVAPRPGRRPYVPAADVAGPAAPPLHPARPLVENSTPRPTSPSSRSQRVRVQRRVDPAVVCAAITMIALALTVVVGLTWT